jgi:hypothetical protein
VTRGDTLRPGSAQLRIGDAVQCMRQEWCRNGDLQQVLFCFYSEVHVLHRGDIEHDRGESLCLGDRSNMMSATEKASVTRGGRSTGQMQRTRMVGVKMNEIIVCIDVTNGTLESLHGFENLRGGYCQL